MKMLVPMVSQQKAAKTVEFQDLGIVDDYYVSSFEWDGVTIESKVLATTANLDSSPAEFRYMEDSLFLRWHYGLDLNKYSEIL